MWELTQAWSHEKSMLRLRLRQAEAEHPLLMVVAQAYDSSHFSPIGWLWHPCLCSSLALCISSKARLAGLCSSSTTLENLKAPGSTGECDEREDCLLSHCIAPPCRSSCLPVQLKGCNVYTFRYFIGNMSILPKRSMYIRDQNCMCVTAFQFIQSD